MTKKQWLQVARAYETPPKRRTHEQMLLAGSGICNAAKAISTGCCDKKADMMIAAKKFNPSNCGYWWPSNARSEDYNIMVYGHPWSRKYDFIRAKVCRAMAKKCE